MSIHGTGVDLIEIDRIQQVVERFGDRFLKRFFSARELAYANGKANPYPHLAARFAAKEAFIKALSPVTANGIRLCDIELALPDGEQGTMGRPNGTVGGPKGPPLLVLYGRAKETLEETGITGIKVSVSHSRRYAVATVILTK